MFNFKINTYTNLILFYAFFLIFPQVVHALDDTRDNQDAPTIRVSLAIDVKEVEIAFSAGGRILDASKDKQIASKEKTQSYKLTSDGSKVKIKDIGGAFTSLQFLPSPGSLLAYKGKKYRGTFRVIAKKSGLTIINDIGIEEYLYGVVSFEVPMSWDIEAIKAQAVAARTYAVRCLNQYPNFEFDVYDSVKDQVYGGISGEKPNSIASVDATRGIILSYQGWPIKAYYCADAGGQTEQSKYVFTNDLPYLQSVQSNDNLEKHRWNFIITKKELTDLFKTCTYKLGDIQNLVITSVSPTGRPGTIKVIGSKGSHEFSSNDFRKTIGAGKVRSTLFTIVSQNGASSEISSGINIRSVSIKNQTAKLKCVSSGGVQEIGKSKVSILGNGLPVDSELIGKTAITAQLGNIYLPVEKIAPKKDEFLFVGSGFGHGVGMSQWGAKAYADSGWDYEQILLHYYRGAELTVWY
jgi:stage II sporulation protein D